MGGLARRVSYIKAFKVRSNKEVPSLFVDAGNVFTDERFSSGQLPPEVMTKNKWVVKSYGDFHHDAANVSYMDLPYMAELLKKDGYEGRAEEFPFIKRLVSANVRPADESLIAPVPYVIREVTLKRGSPGRTLKVAVVGFTDLKPDPMSNNPNNKQGAYAGFVIDDPFAAARRILPEIKQQADFVIALAYMPQDLAQRLASENPEIDTLIGARQVNSQEAVQHFNRATIAYAFNQTKYLGEMRVYVSADGTVENQVNRFVGLDSIIPDDPYAVEAVKGAHDEFTNQQNESAKSAGPATRPAGFLDDADSPYIGGETCAGCHVEEHEIWQKTGHAHAMATLENKNQQFDTECVGCHVVGFQKGGFKALYSTPQFANVQCEACHGPGREHAARPAKGYGQIQTPVGCVQCHTQPNSPDFVFETYWPKVAHKNSIIR